MTTILHFDTFNACTYNNNGVYTFLLPTAYKANKVGLKSIEFPYLNNIRNQQNTIILINTNLIHGSPAVPLLVTIKIPDQNQTNLIYLLTDINYYITSFNGISCVFDINSSGGVFMKCILHAADFVIQGALSYFNSKKYYINTYCSATVQVPFTDYYASSYFPYKTNVYSYQLLPSNLSLLLGFENKTYTSIPTKIIEATSLPNLVYDTYYNMIIKYTSTTGVNKSMSFKITSKNVINNIIYWSDKSEFEQYIYFHKDIEYKQLEVQFFDRFYNDISPYLQNKNISFTLELQNVK